MYHGTFVHFSQDICPKNAGHLSGHSSLEIEYRVRDRERDKDIIIARSSNLLRSLASKPAPEFPMKRLSDHGYLEPGEPIAIRGDRASDDE